MLPWLLDKIKEYSNVTFLIIICDYKFYNQKFNNTFKNNCVNKY